MAKNKFQIRNSTAEFLVFTSQSGKNTIEVRVENETVWLTQNLIAELFQTTKQNIGQHLKNIFTEAESCAKKMHKFKNQYPSISR